MIIYISITLLLLLISFRADKQKTLNGLKISLHHLIRIIPILLVITIAASILFTILPANTISKALSNNITPLSFLTAITSGSILEMPGYVVFPVAALLKEQGIPMILISGLTTSLLMVGIINIPIEAKYFGIWKAVLRNLFAVFISIAVAIITGIAFGEISIW